MARDRTEPPPPISRIGPTDVAELIATGDDGKLNARLTEVLRDVTAAVEELGGDGHVTIKIKVRKQGKVAAVGYEVTLKKPTPATREQIYYFADGGGLAADDPRQTAIEFTRPPRVIKPTDND